MLFVTSDGMRNEVKLEFDQLAMSYLAITWEDKLKYSTIILRDTAFPFLYIDIIVCSEDCVVDLWR
jgi:hypothetical protein